MLDSELARVRAPAHLTGQERPSSLHEVYDWEDGLVHLLEPHWQGLTPFSDYFRLRTYEFRTLRTLLPEVFSVESPSAVTAEIGCGFGFGSLLLLPFARHVRGFDIPVHYPSHAVGEAENSVQVARHLASGLLGRRDLTFDTAWPHELPLDDASVDLIYSQYVLEHVPDIADVAREMGRVVRPGGTAVHIVPNAIDALMELARANARVPLRSLVAGLLRRGTGGRTALSLNGTIVPPVHSEFLTHFSEQFGVYSMERFTFPMIEAGFDVVHVTVTRESNRAIVFRRSSRAVSSTGVGR